MDAPEISTKKEKDIKGWLAFFVYVWVGLGSILSVALSLILLISQRADLDVSIFLLLYDVFPLLIGIATVRAFVLEKNNAVSLARTFLIMRIMLGVMMLFIGWVCANPFLYAYSMMGCVLESILFTPVGNVILSSVVQCVIWFVYLHRSKQVKSVIPIEMRTWNKFEKILLSVYVLLVLFLILGGYYVYVNEQSKAAKHIEQVSEYELEQTESMANTDVTVIYQFPHAFVCAEIEADSLALIRKEFVQFIEGYAKVDTTILKSLKKGDNVVCELLDANNEVVYRVGLKKDTIVVKKKVITKQINN